MTSRLLHLLWLVQAVFFFHPLVWWLNKIIRHEREKCCDEMAVAMLWLGESLRWGQLWGSLVIVAGLAVGLPQPSRRNLN